MNISPIMANQYNNKSLKRNFNNHPTEQQPISPNFGGVYGNITDGIAKNYYGKAMQSGFVKWLGKKTENMNMINKFDIIINMESVLYLTVRESNFFFSVTQNI